MRKNVVKKAAGAKPATKKTAARKTTTRKPSLYDQLKKMGWGFLLKTYSPEHIQKLTETP